MSLKLAAFGSDPNGGVKEEWVRVWYAKTSLAEPS